MGLESIGSSPARVLQEARSAATPAAPLKLPAATQEPKPGPATDAKSPVRGVPQRLAVPPQLPPNTRLRVDEETNTIVAQILDENNEVVRQIPPEALLDLSTRFNRLEGLLFDRQT